MNKGRKIVLILVIAVLCGFLIYGFEVKKSGGISFSTADQMISYLSNKKPDHLNCICSDKLYSMLFNNDFYELRRILLWAGIDSDEAKISHNNGLSSLSLRNLKYTGLPCEEAITKESLNRAVAKLSVGNDTFLILCREDFHEQMVRRKLLEKAAAANGIDSYTSEYNELPGYVRVSDVKYFDEPYAYVKDRAALAAAVDGFAEKNTADFYLVCDQKLLDTLPVNLKEISAYFQDLGLDSFDVDYDSDRSLLHIQNAVYAQN